jgi:hypothetical protein
LPYLLIAAPLYGLTLVGGILLWSWLNHRDGVYVVRGYPKDLLDKVPPLPKERQAVAMRRGIAYAVWAKLALGEPFLTVWLAAAILLLTHNALDLVVIDWLVICWLTPRFMLFPGTEGHPAYKDYGFHFRGFLKGLVFVAVGSLLFAGIAELVGVFF